MAEGGILDSTEIEIALYGLEPPPDDDGRQEPLFALAPVMIGFDEPEQPILDNEPLPDGTTRFQPAFLDVEMASDEPEDPFPEPLPMSRLAVAGALAMYSLVFVALLAWPDTPMALSDPIPVQLVIETPKPQQQQAQAQATPPPSPQQEQVRRSSDDSGAVTPTPKPEESKAAATAPPPSPEKSPSEQAPPPKPLPPMPQQEASAIPPPPPPKPTPPAKPVVHVAAKPAAPPSPRTEEVYHPPARRASVEGPPATRDEYLATLVRLTKQHINLLTPVLGNRRGETKVGVRVLDDGTIANVAVVESSGYPDIDRRIEQMVLDVGRFPPLPQWFQGNEMQLELRLRFPEALQD